MSTMPVYPLQEVLEVKKRRVDDAERVVKQREQELANEKEKLIKCEQQRDKVKQHYHDKLDQLRLTLDGETNTDIIQQMRAYIKVVQENLSAEEEKVFKQGEQVRIAERNLSDAKEELLQRRREVDKIETHKKEWFKEAMKEVELKESIEMNEIGSIIYTTRRKR